MIVHPENWEKVGQAIGLKEIGDMILQILSEIPCNSLALSGGLDSTLLLYFMLKVHKKINAFTIGSSEKHRDIKYSVLAAEELGRTKHIYYVPTQKEIDEDRDQARDFKGDKAVRLFYKFVAKHTDKMIAGDGVDEYMCGYYGHQVPRTELAYFEYIRRLRLEHLEPLNRNSMGVKVYLPYLDARLLYLLYQIPTYEKVSRKQRKMLMIEMAEGRIPEEILMRDKIGFCNALNSKRRSIASKT